MIYHDEWTKNVQYFLAEIKKETNTVERLKKSLELANYNVAYYEQFVNEKIHSGSWVKAYEDDYHTALRKRALIRDKLMDLNIFE